MRPKREKKVQGKKGENVAKWRPTGWCARGTPTHEIKILFSLERVLNSSLPRGIEHHLYPFLGESESQNKIRFGISIKGIRAVPHNLPNSKKSF